MYIYCCFESDSIRAAGMDEMPLKTSIYMYIYIYIDRYEARGYARIFEFVNRFYFH